MYSLRAFILCCSALGVISATLEASNDVVWAQSEYLNDDSIRNFTVEFKDADIADLIARLENTRSFKSYENVGFQYGFNTDILSDWVNYWAKEYDFSARQKWLNVYPQFKTNIQGLDMHFLWTKSEVTDDNCKVVPVLMLHGFPDSVIEFYKAIPKLTDRCVDGYALDLVIPSLPGFAFSDAPTVPGMGPVEIATVMKNLMNRLGYNKFYVQSGDYFQIGSMLATVYPDEVLGLHTNNAVTYNPVSLAMWLAGSLDTSLVVESEDKDRLYPVAEKAQELLSGYGILYLLATKPDTIGIAMANTPQGLLACLLELASTETRHDNVYKPDGGLSVFGRDDLIDTINYYWFTNSFTTAARTFANTFNLATYRNKAVAQRTSTPVYAVHAKHEIIYQSEPLLKVKYQNLLHTEMLNDLGRFFAYENETLFAESVFRSISMFGKFHENKSKSEF